MDNLNEKRWISGFWRRIVALVIDSFILAVVGLSAGLFFEDVFVQMGVWGRLLGFFIALIYFGVMNSSLTNGQTIGKKILKIRVVDANNKPINLIRSFCRYSIIGAPFFLNNAQFPDTIMFSVWMYPLSLMIFGGIF
jgi:uncharacterized RDD family membrane protein YckC